MNGRPTTRCRRGGPSGFVFDTDGLPDGRLLGTVPDVDAARPLVAGALRDP